MALLLQIDLIYVIATLLNSEYYDILVPDLKQ